ncbi:MAG: hypothetical protein CMK09_08395 [Ponticaulis sp.]|nr:hypothetical protein [Ponticaulis sp.]
MRIAIDWKKRGREFAILIAIGTFLSIVGPYGATARMEFWQSWLYWVALIFIGSFVGWGVAYLIDQRFPGRPVWIMLLCTCSLSALAITIVLISADLAFDGRTTVLEFFILYGFVWVISAAVTGIGYLLHVFEESRAVREAAGQPASEETIRNFMSRLPLPYRNADLFAISSEDHYLRIHTSAGEHMMLERLANAIRELEGAKGLQTHRSWWVAESGVQSASSSDGRITLVLKSGTSAPVSRTYAKTVREAGWV